MTINALSGAVAAVLTWGWGSHAARALIFFETGDVTHNREVAPDGAWAGSGWQHQGYYKNFLGTMISPRHFITARHLGGGTSVFVHKSFFSGVEEDRTYYINPNLNSGAGYWDIAGTDLRVFEVYGDFPAYAPLWTGGNEVGKEVVMMGRGRARGVAVTRSGETRGWQWGTDDKRARWGVNDIDSITESETAGDLLVTDFDEAPGSEECHAASGDSGGAVFIKDGATWKLAGIMYAVDGKYDTNTTCGDSSDFHAAMFDASGFFIGEDNAECDEWEAVSVSEDEDESRTYSSRISSSAGAIQGIIQEAIDDAAKTHAERYEEWIMGFGMTTDLLPGEDADGDLTPNAIEYLAALHPGAVDVPKRAFEVVEAGDKIRFLVRLRLDAEARGLTWEIRECAELATQSYVVVSGLAQVGVSRALTEGVEIVEYELDKPDGLRRFYRLEVTLAP